MHLIWWTCGALMVRLLTGLVLLVLSARLADIVLLQCDGHAAGPGHLHC